VSRAFRSRYGSNPLHLLGHLAAFAIAAYALVQILDGSGPVNFAVWFLSAALLHDIIFLPLYSVLDRIAHRGVTRTTSALRSRHAVPLINHVRAPALISGLLLLVYFPLILGAADRTYRAATGHSVHGYLRNWLLITAALFAVSALVFAVRVRRASRP
jgi:uncharacterized membrane protein YhdT